MADQPAPVHGRPQPARPGPDVGALGQARPPRAEREPSLKGEALQRALAARIDPRGDPAPGPTLALDVQYADDVAHVGGAWLSADGIEAFAGEAHAGAPYTPGLFCFREGPPLLALVRAIVARRGDPALLIVDGHGIAHPRRFGAACWLGLATGIPTLGCAKRSLVPWTGVLDDERGATLDVDLAGETVGQVVRTRDYVKPVYVSPGHRIGLSEASARVLALPGRCRLPDPCRAADHAARARAKGAARAWIELGTLPSEPVAWDA